ncbi:hypothetical protein SAMN02745752_00801 [Marinospirillum alkaliphilum DSM 21637]|uniref:Uncharacterized protein n=1 Tax=Marinospirillum alkaliphilum DSM 21637 TaxID=1122209 RepID=A0A1K1V664_9GAMM|nr:hypothetical protein SAMN02745752_00801 [Marinospirillum alkaliphilum DSM 21637]
MMLDITPAFCYLIFYKCKFTETLDRNQVFQLAAHSDDQYANQRSQQQKMLKHQPWAIFCTADIQPPHTSKPIRSDCELHPG